MQLMDATDTTKLDYWLNWRVLICALWVLGSMASASYVIWKNEGSGQPKHDRKETPRQLPELLCDDDDAWRTCLREIHPIWLLAYRVVSFFVLSAILVNDIRIHGTRVLFYYTQWTFALITVYFGLASILSFYGCYQRHKIAQKYNSQSGVESNHGSYFPLSYGEAITTDFLEDNTCIHEKCVLESGIWGKILQVLFQLGAGAVMLTDCIYWSIIYPFLSINDYDLHMMTYMMHSVNFMFIIGDAALNSLHFPWFRISYLVLWTGLFVVSQWIVHACVSMRWPYLFLDLSSPFSPLWYVLVGLMQLPCYGIFVMIVEAKASFFSRRFPQSCQRFR